MTPLAKKLLMKPRQRWLLLNAPVNYMEALMPLPSGFSLSLNPVGVYDGIQLFVKNKKELSQSLKKVKDFLHPQITLWVTYPKKSSGVDSDLNMMSSWDELTKYELGGVAAAAIDENWTALRFRSQQLIRKDPTCNDEIANSPYSSYVDVVNRVITLPENIADLLASKPMAQEFFNKLSFTNRREYVLWVLTARQEKTKEERLKKMMEKLIDGKKNPSEK